MHLSLVICPRGSSKDSLEKKVFKDPCFVHVDFFLHKDAYNSIAVRIFYYKRA